MQMLNGALERASVFWLWLQQLAPTENGQTLAEYALIMSVISVAVITLGVFGFRNELIVAYNAATNCIDGAC